MSASVSLQQRLQQLKKLQADLPNVMHAAARDATMRAIEATMDATPPKAGGDRLPGVNTVTGELKAHWETDSVTEPQKVGGGYVTFLANDMEYASYVNNGHRMDRHFVPGLVINPESGMLEYNPDGKGGIVVGTRTQYVEGLFMEEAAHEEYHRVVRVEADRLRRMLE